MKKLILSIICVILFLLTFTAVEIIAYGNKDYKTHSDVAVILGAGTYGDEVSPVFRERINHGIWLYENGFVDYLIFTGGVGEGNIKSDALVAREYAVSKSVPEESIFIEEKSTITEENLEFAKKIMDENAFKNAIIVSDPLHMKRAMLMVKDYGIEGVSSPTTTSMYKSIKTKIPFLLREEFFYIGYKIVRLFR